MQINHLVARKSKALVGRGFRALLRLLPRNRKVWVFGSRFGERYDENSKYLFEYVNRFAPEIKAIWLTKNPIICEFLRERGYKAYMAGSLYGYLYSAIAGVAIVSVCMEDVCVNKMILREAKVIQLWHGTPLKTNDISALGEDYAMVILAAEEFLHDQLLGDKDKFHFVVTGYPRNDILLSSQTIEKVEQLKTRYQCDKIVLYLPTYRDNAVYHCEEFDVFESFGFDLDSLEDLMNYHRTLFIIKLHPLQTIRDITIAEQIHKSNHLHLINASDPLEDVYEYLKYTDILITDYSSVYFDFLLRNRPIIFAPFDFDSYVARRPLRFSYDEVTPGPKAKNWMEICAFLQEILAGRDDWTKLRQSVNRRFNAYQDGGSSERVYMKIRSLLGLYSND